MDKIIKEIVNLPIYKQKNFEYIENNNNNNIYLIFAILFGIIIFLFEFYLDFRQFNKFKNAKKIPDELSNSTIITEEKFKQSLEYGKDKYSFGLIQSFLLFIESLLLLCYGFFPFLWDFSNNICLKYYLYINNENNNNNNTNDKIENSSLLRKEIMITLIFLLLVLLHDIIISLPFSLYSNFVIEQKHNFNKYTLFLFFKDKLLMILLSIVIGSPIISLMIYIIRISGENFFFYVWLFLCVISLLLITIFPIYIAPLFNKYKKLNSGNVFDAISDLANVVKFPLTQIYEVDGSKRSAHSNAYFYGFFKNKRIVLYDTLLKQVNIPEIQAILGHEMGHWKLWHSLQGFIISQTYTLLLFLFFSYMINNKDMYTSFGFAYNKTINEDGKMPIMVGLIIFIQTLWAPIEKLLSFLLNCNSRINEFAADEFSRKLGFGNELCTGLIKISVENLGCLVPDTWYSIYHYSHPPLIERLRAIQLNDKKNPCNKTVKIIDPSTPTTTSTEDSTDNKKEQ